MNNKILTKLSSLVLIIAILLSCVTGVFAAGNTWKPSADTQIYWVKTSDSLLSNQDLVAQVQLFDSELAAKVTDTALPIVYGEKEDAGKNDILLILDKKLDIKAEGYKLTISGNQAIISASDRDGLFYGCRNLIQQMLANSSVSDNAEHPDVRERGVSLDNGRKYFTVTWIKEFIREMSWANMNTLALHFSEEMGLGIESKLYPWLAGRDGTLCTQAEVATDNRYLTQAEVAEIVNYAKLYHVQIIPSFDSPGHMNYVVKKFNEQCAKKDYTFTYDGKTYTANAGSEIGNYFHYNGKTTIVKGSRNTNYSRGIDISNEVAVAFTKSLIEEYATLFHNLGCTQFDIGGDELLGWGSAVVSTSQASRWQQLDHWKAYAIEKTGNKQAVAYDAFLLYMNDLNKLVTGLGYTSTRMWNDDALRSSDTGWTGVVQLDKSIDIWYWTPNPNSVSTYLNAGHKVHNILNSYTYYVLSSSYLSEDRTIYPNAYPDIIYNQWSPYVFDPDNSTLGSGKNPAAGNPGVLGSAIGIWCDNPPLRTESAMMSELLPLIRAHGTKAWDIDCNKTVSYNNYTARLEKLGNAPSKLPKASDITEYIKLDLTAYNQAIAEFNAIDASKYTQASFDAYSNAVEAAKAIAQSGKSTQAELDAAVATVQEKKLLLAPVRADSRILAVQPASSRFINSERVILTVLVRSDVSGIEIYDSLGRQVSLTAFSMVSNTDSDTQTATVQFSKVKVLKNTYRVYTIDKEGNRSAGSVEFMISD